MSKCLSKIIIGQPLPHDWNNWENWKHQPDQEKNIDSNNCFVPFINFHYLFGDEDPRSDYSPSCLVHSSLESVIKYFQNGAMDRDWVVVQVQNGVAHKIISKEEIV